MKVNTRFVVVLLQYYYSSFMPILDFKVDKETTNITLLYLWTWKN